MQPRLLERELLLQISKNSNFGIRLLNVAEQQSITCSSFIVYECNSKTIIHKAQNEILFIATRNAYSNDNARRLK